MSLFSRFRRRRTARASRKPAPVRLSVEALEDRAVPAFLPPVSYPSDTTLLSELQVGDFNNDGHVDLAHGAGTPGNIVVRLGNGDGSFQAALTTVIGIGQVGFPLEVGDFNRDGLLDLVVTPFFGLPENTLVLLGNGDGSFREPAASVPGSGVVGDLNNDGLLDLVLITPGVFPRYDIHVQLGNGDGSFRTGSVTSGFPFYLAGLGDFNRDGKLDVLTRGSVLLGNGDGTLGAALPITGLRGFIHDVADLNGDGTLDFVADDTDVSGGLDTAVDVFLGNGDGTFQPRRSFAVDGAFTVAVADFNRDGRLDLVTTNGASAVGILLGNGDGTFQSVRFFDAGAFADKPVTADFNSDGFPDLAVIGGVGFSVLLNDENWPALPPIPLSLRISDVSHLEGRRGTTAFVFTVSLSAASSQTVTVRFATRDGTATVADDDYRAAAGTLTFAPGQTSQTITVLVNGDRRREGDETFTVELFDAVFATIADGQRIGTIRNDD